MQLSGPQGQAGAGSAEWPIRGDFTPFVGLDVFTQCLILDREAEDGFALSNGLEVRVR